MDDCVCEKYAEQRQSSPNCMAFWCPIHDDIEGKFARLEKRLTEPMAVKTRDEVLAIAREVDQLLMEWREAAKERFRQVFPELFPLKQVINTSEVEPDGMVSEDADEDE